MVENNSTFLGAKGLTPYDALNIFDSYIQKGWRVEYGIVDQADNGFWDRDTDKKIDGMGNPFTNRYTYETFVYPPEWGDWLNKYHMAGEFLPELLCELAFKLQEQLYNEYSKEDESYDE